MLNKIKPIIVQFMKFGLVGASNTIISLVVYYVLLFLNIHYMFANISGYMISSLWGYILNKIWVFGRKGKTGGSIVKYYIVYGSSLLLNIVLMFLWVDIFSISEIIAPILTMCITVPYNYILSKVWVFK